MPTQISNIKDRHWPFTTPESKREFARVLDGDLKSDHRDEWLALADIQEAGRLEEYHADREAWKAQEPKAKGWLDAHTD